MGCFPCFKPSKNRKQKKSTTSSPSVNQFQVHDESRPIAIPTEESTTIDSLENPVCGLRDNSEDANDERTKLDFDAKTSVDFSIEDAEIYSLESEYEREKEGENVGKGENEKLVVLEEIEDTKENEKKLKEEDENLGADVEIESEKVREKDVKKEENGSEVQSKDLSDSSASSYISYPPMHRYHNCLIDEEDKDDVLIQHNSSGSLFSLPIDSRRQSKSNRVEVDDKEVNSPLKTASPPELKNKSNGYDRKESDHNQKIASALNPKENLSQWKTLKARPIPVLDHEHEKENANLDHEEIHIPLSEEPKLKNSEKKEKPNNDVVVTTSLSSWLVESEQTPTASKGESRFSTADSYSYSDGANSWKSFEDRPILGALTVEEVREISVRSSPRKSPNRNPDEMPIIGSVGSYWSHTGQAMDSSKSYSSPSRFSRKSRRTREDNISSCHSTSFNARLERAIDRGAA